MLGRQVLLHVDEFKLGIGGTETTWYMTLSQVRDFFAQMRGVMQCEQVGALDLLVSGVLPELALQGWKLHVHGVDASLVGSHFTLWAPLGKRHICLALLGTPMDNGADMSVADHFGVATSMHKLRALGKGIWMLTGGQPRATTWLVLWLRDRPRDGVEAFIQLANQASRRLDEAGGTSSPRYWTSSRAWR